MKAEIEILKNNFKQTDKSYDKKNSDVNGKIEEFKKENDTNLLNLLLKIYRKTTRIAEQTNKIADETKELKYV